jgi:hypothetical protein
MPPAYTLRIGSLTFSFYTHDRRWRDFLKKYFGVFSVTAPAHNTIEIVPGRLSRRKLLYVERKDDRWIIERADFASSSSSDFRKTVLTVERDKYSFNSWLRVFCTLFGVSRSSILLHSAGVCSGERVYIFPGRSGAGKSTITRLLGKGSALSDELVLVNSSRKKSVIASSTPFWGELKKGSGKLFAAPVGGLFFLRHGPALSVSRLSRGEALKRLLPTILFFAKEQTSIDRLLSLAVGVVQQVPSFELTFSLRTSRGDIIRRIEKETTTEKHL